MNKIYQELKCVLGLVASSRGVGFAVMSGDGRLVDWGVKSVKGGNKNERSLFHAANLIERYHPVAIALENPDESRRGSRVQALLRGIIELAQEEQIAVKTFSRKAMNRKLLNRETATKHEVAERVAGQFSAELGFRLPPKRKLWTSEASQMDVFQAVGFAESALEGKGNRAIV